jgi:hypothetical protein
VNNLHFTSLDKESKAVFDRYLTPYPFLASTYSFTNLYIWRNSQNLKYHEDGEALYLLKGRDNPLPLPPLVLPGGDLKASCTKLLEEMTRRGLPRIFRDADLRQVRALQDLGFSFTAVPDRDNFEYIYQVEKLRSLSGKALHGKKNHYNNFIRNNAYTIRFVEDCKEECLQLARRWYEESDQNPALLEELEGIHSLLSDPAFFNIKGIAVFIDGQCQAFTLLEILNDQVILNHIEKAEKKFSGLYAFLAKTALDEFGEGILYTNREQDMGIPGLRKSKESYSPEFLEEKYRLIFD